MHNQNIFSNLALLLALGATLPGHGQEVSISDLNLQILEPSPSL
jgi:hypothetical protein